MISRSALLLFLSVTSIVLLKITPPVLAGSYNIEFDTSFISGDNVSRDFYIAVDGGTVAHDVFTGAGTLSTSLTLDDNVGHTVTAWPIINHDRSVYSGSLYVNGNLCAQSPDVWQSNPLSCSIPASQPSCQYGGTYPNCNPQPTCQYGGTYPNCNPQPTCQYGGTYPNCNPQLTVSITVTSTGGSAPLSASFSSSVSGGTGGYPTYAWDFGDHEYASSPISATHTYVAPGVYYASLTVTDSQGTISKSNTLAIQVTPPKPTPRPMPQIWETNEYDVDDFALWLNLLGISFSSQNTNMAVTVTVDPNQVRSVVLKVSNGVAEFRGVSSNTLHNNLPTTYSNYNFKVLSHGTFDKTTLVDFILYVACKSLNAFDKTRVLGKICNFYQDMTSAMNLIANEHVHADRLDVTYNDGTSQQFQLGNDYPNVVDALNKKPANWLILALDKLRIIVDSSDPADLLYTDSQGLRVGSIYQNGVFVSEINEIPGAYSSGHGTDPQVIIVPSDSGGSVTLSASQNTQYSFVSLEGTAQNPTAFEKQGTISSGQSIVLESLGNVRQTEGGAPSTYIFGLFAIVVMAVFIAAVAIYLGRRSSRRTLLGRLHSHGFCLRCGTPLRQGSRFCLRCGTATRKGVTP